MKTKISIIHLSLLLIIVSYVSWRSHAAVDCNKAGRFPDPSDSNCQNYTLCVYVISNSSYIGYEYKCPTTSVFNPNTAKCTAPSNYVCGDPNTTQTPATTTTSTTTTPASTTTTPTPTTPTTTTPTSTTTTTTTTPTSTTTASPPASECTKAGRFPVDSDPNCKNYTLCVYDPSSKTYLAYKYTCPTISVFNPNTAKCTDPSIYKCGSTTPPSNSKPTTTSVPSTTPAVSSTTTTPTTKSSSSECSAAGRFPVADDKCQKYILCVYDLPNKKYIKYEYKCPTTSVFNPNTAKCTTPENYECNGDTTKPASTNTPDTTTPEVTTPEATTPEASTPVPEEAVVCTDNEYVADPNSKDCTGYLLCLEAGAVPIPEKCEIGAYNPATTYCELDYVCPN